MIVKCIVLPFLLLSAAPTQPAPSRNEIAWSLKYDPKTFDPAKVDDQDSETIRFLTGGTLLRINRSTQALEPALASSWEISPDGRLVRFHLRGGLQFSDSSALTSKDVTATLARLLDPATAAPVAEEFVAPHEVSVSAPDPLTIEIRLPRRVVSILQAFDEIAIEPAGRPSSARVTAGPFLLADYQRGSFLRLARNPKYWRKDSVGHSLPYLESIHLDILANREQDLLRFSRGQYQLVNALPPDGFQQLARTDASAVHDLGPSLNTEQMWFNQAPSAPLPEWEKQWFAASAFRTAVSMAIHRADLARIAYDGHATPAFDYISPANKMWHNTALRPAPENAGEAAQILARAGFHRAGGGPLQDREGHPVKFSIVTNAGNRAREKMAALIQQDLSALGMQVNVVTLDFPALLERLTHNQNYEAALLGLTNVALDPSEMMNVWLSSSPNHQWNPSQKTPATPWEAEIDHEMLLQSTSPDYSARKRAVDRVQTIVAEQVPFIYLVHPNTLAAVSPALEGVRLTVLQPGVISNIDQVRWKDTR